MAKRPQIAINPMPKVYAWVRHEELHRAVAKTIVATAGFAALRLLNDTERDEMFRWAKLVDEGQITWEDFEEVAGQDQKKRAKALQHQLRLALEREAATDQARSTKQA